MALTPTSIYDNSATPGIAAELFVPDQLIAGDFKLVTQPITVPVGSALIARGTVLGMVTATGYYIPSLVAAVDGSQTPVCIAADAIQQSAGGVVTGAAYFSGEFNANYLSIGTWTLSALANLLRDASIFIKVVPSGLSNATPT